MSNEELLVDVAILQARIDLLAQAVVPFFENLAWLTVLKDAEHKVQR